MLRSFGVAGLCLAFGCSCPGGAKVDTKATVDNGKVSASVDDYHPGRVDLRGPGSSTSIMGTGPHGSFDIRLGGTIAPTPGGRARLDASPDGQMLAFSPDVGAPWFVFYLTPRRKALTSDYEYPSGGLASRTRVEPGSTGVDWAKVPSFLEVAADIVRNAHPNEAEEYYQDVFGEVNRRGGEAALVKVLADTSDMIGADTGYAWVHEEVCGLGGGKSEWLRAYRTVPAASRKPIEDALAKKLATPKLDAELVVRAGMTLPMDAPAPAAVMAERTRELFAEKNEMADVARGLMLRRLVVLDPKLAADVGCEYVTKRYADPVLKRPSAEASESAALFAIAFAKSACPAVMPESANDGPTDVSIADEAKDPIAKLVERVGRCAVPSPTSSDYLHFAKAVQPPK